MLAGNVGADYKITRDTVLGVSVGMREQELAVTSTDVDHSVVRSFRVQAHERADRRPQGRACR